MKINQIYSLTNANITKQNTPITDTRHKTIPIKNSKESLSLNNLPSAVLGKSIIQFRGLPFEQTVEQNFFKLPVDCQPDEYQKMAANSIYNGHDTLVTAPTGTGKTAIAYYAISKNMEDGKKTFYTTPLKALSNEKYRQLQKIFGEKNVGLLTGDIKVNPEAPIIVMTTEIYRNMVFGDKFKNTSTSLDNLKTVIFDELHYMGDVDRGGIWEQSIILSNKKTQLLSLSATIGNGQDINKWMSKVREKEGNLINVPPERRHVPLEEFKPTNVNINPKKFEASNLTLVNELRKQNKLPAIFFVFSKKQSRSLINYFKTSGLRLNTKEEQKEVKKIINDYRKNGKYLGERLDTDALKSGYAIHNAGLLPEQKELIEELFQKKLLKTVIATETLAAGINMPARTVVITSIRKPTNIKFADGIDGKRFLNVNEFHQMVGRAGRRGIDIKGYYYAMPKDSGEEKLIQSLIKSAPEPIVSHFEPDYSFITNYHSFTQDEGIIKELLSKSFQAYDDNTEKSSQKAKELLDKFNEKKAILKDFGYLNADNTLTTKGELLSKLNGYQQIPIIDMISDKKLFALTPVELAGSVGSMSATNEQAAEMNERIKEKLKSKKSSQKDAKFKHENSTFSWFIDKADEYLEKYNEKMSKNDNFHNIAQNKDTAKRLFDWANLNNKNEDAKLNWQTMCNKYLDDYIDEGSIFKEVTQTIDLLKQITGISEIGIKKALNHDDHFYYKSLKETAEEAIKLLTKEPIASIRL